ncbi:hypothetical protein GGI21_006230, partial [Coemansia aciculifera]
MPSARASLDMGAARRTHRPSDSAAGRAPGNGIGAWLSKYSLRGGSGSGGSRSSANSTGSSTASSSHTRNASAEIARHSIDSTLAAMQLTTGGALVAAAAVITATEVHAPAPGPSSALRVGRSKQRSTVVYRILVSGRPGGGAQWWALRSFAEFHELHTLRWSSSSTPPPQSADRLNGFLRAIMADADICASDDVQRFLKDNSSAVMSPVSDDGRGVAHFDAAHRMPLPDAWGASPHSPGRDSMERVSMPVLKDHHYQYVCVAQTATPPTSGPKHVFTAAPSLPPPAVPPRPAKHQSMGMDHPPKSPLSAVLGEEAAALQVLRKASDSLLY